MGDYLLLKQGTIHNAITEEPFVADILIEDGKIKKIAPVLEGKAVNDARVLDAMGLDLWRRTATSGLTATREVMRGRIIMS